MAPANAEGWIDVCRIERIAPDRGVCALVGGEQVAVFRLGRDGELLAISNYDPFSRAFVLSRGIVGTKGDVVKVASPVYKQTFDLRTGVCIEKPEVRVPTYQVRLQGRMVQVLARQTPAPLRVSASARTAPETRDSSSASSGEPGVKGAAEQGRPLAGFRVTVWESRERERLVEMLEAKGAEVSSCPLFTTREADDTSAVESWLKNLAAGRFKACVFFTGEGVRCLLGAAERMAIRDDVVRALRSTDTVTRGPKPARALRDLGILPTHPAEVPTSQGVLDLLKTSGLRGATLGVQLYPRISSRRFVRSARDEGIDVQPVWPYAYQNAADDATVQKVVTRMASGHCDLVIFTSRAQVDALFDVTSRLDLRAALEAGLRRTRIAAMGPVAASALRARGLRAGIVPSELFFMKSLVREIVAAWATTSAA
jgi:uroporphyrinogen-III synthase